MILTLQGLNKMLSLMKSELSEHRYEAHGNLLCTFAIVDKPKPTPRTLLVNPSPLSLPLCFPPQRIEISSAG